MAFSLKMFWNFDRDYIEFLWVLWTFFFIMNILVVFVIQIYVHGTSFHLFVFSQFISLLSYRLQCIGLSPPWLSLFLCILFFPMLLIMGLFS